MSILTFSSATKKLPNLYLCIRMVNSYFFGFDYFKYENFFVPVADVEKTLLDLVYFNEIPAEDVLIEIKKQIKKEKLERYLKNFPPKFRKRVYSFLEVK